MKRSRQLSAASAALAAGLWLAGCRARGAAEQGPGGNQEMKVEQTPVGSIYEEKGGVLYERPAATPTATTPPPATPSPRPHS
ncbi:MAG TPA: hypothetical protein VGS00_01795 [Thermoanaerobaculia bacterium]|nr:hypothetical protein [Thermoanaerobaculia bacterium]